MRVVHAAVCAGVLSSALLAHDLFLRLDSYFLEPGTKASVALINGVFDRSDNIVTRDRMVDVSVVGPPVAARAHPPNSAWRDVGKASWLDFETGASGTYALGVSTKPRMIELSAEKFQAYLKHDGVLDVLEQRKAAGVTDQPARERYSKHVKAIVQVGMERSAAFGAVLGYPIEIVPLRNPYRCRSGDELGLRVLRDGKPLAGQLLYASPAGHHEHSDSGGHVEAFSGRTDDAGEVRIPLSRPGRWYARLIHMTEAPEEDVDYESQWATLTFEVASAPPSSSGTWLPILLGAVAAMGALWMLSKTGRQGAG